MADIGQFLANLKGGGARSNRFEVVINFPAFAGGSEEIRKTAFLAQSTNMPPSTLGVIEQPFRGRVIKLPGDRVYDEWTCTFVNDTDFALHDAFELWHNAMNAYNSNTGANSPDEVFSSATVYQLDNQDNRIKEKTMKLAWPSNIGQIELAQDSNNTIETFEVTFQFSDIDNGNST
jgi:hypothetical protein